MAFVSFYLINGGTGASDINAGSSTGAAQVTTTNGNWNSGTGVFIAASGQHPFTSTTTSDYASVYVDSSTVTTFVGKVTTVTSDSQITVDVSSIKYGTAPSTSATARSCTINGAWNTEQVLAAGGLATTTVPQSTKINIKQATIALSTNRTISMAGATTTPLWFSGYNTTPGDLDNDTTNSLTKPSFTCSSGELFATGAHQLWTSLAFTGSANRSLAQFTAATVQLQRCRFTNTNSGSSTRAIDFNNGGNALVADCYFKSPATATGVGIVGSIGGSASFEGCVFDTGGLAGIDFSNTTNNILTNCVFTGTVAGVLLSTGAVKIRSCTFYNGTDGVKWTGTPGARSYVIGSLFSTLTNGINNNSGTNTNLIYRACNDYYSVTNPETGLGDSPAFFGQTDSNNPLVSATNLTPLLASNAFKNGFPGIFENETFSSYASIGAVIPINPAGLFIQ